MLEIRQINEKDYQLIVNWNEGKDKDYLNQWAGSKIYQYPITIDQIKEHDKDNSSQIYIILCNSKMIFLIIFYILLILAHISHNVY